MATEAEAALGTIRSSLRAMYAQTGAYNVDLDGNPVAAGPAVGTVPGIAAGDLDGRWFDDFIAVTRVAVRKGRIRVTHARCIRIERGASDHLLSAGVRQLWRDARVPTRTVGLCLRTPSLAIKRFARPDLSPEAFEIAVQEEAK